MDAPRPMALTSSPPRPHRFAVVLASALVAAATACSAQDTTFYSAKGKVASLNECDQYVVSGPDPEMPERQLRVSRTRAGLLRWEKLTITEGTNDPVEDGISRQYDVYGTLRLEREYAKGTNVRIASFWKEGQPRRVDLYANDSLVSGSCFKEDGSPDTYYPFLTQPVFKGGMDAMYAYMMENVRYPKKALKKDVVGKVLVSFIVDTDGTIVDAQVTRPVDPLLDAEALRVVREMPAWEPGKTDDIPVRCRFNLPVVFSTGAGKAWAD